MSAGATTEDSKIKTEDQVEPSMAVLTTKAIKPEVILITQQITTIMETKADWVHMETTTITNQPSINTKTISRPQPQH